MSERKSPPPRPGYDPALIERLCERVYRDQLGAGGAARMIAQDKDDGAKLRRRAMSYASVVRATLDALAAEPRA